MRKCKRTDRTCGYSCGKPVSTHFLQYRCQYSGNFPSIGLAHLWCQGRFPGSAVSIPIRDACPSPKKHTVPTDDQQAPCRVACTAHSHLNSSMYGRARRSDCLPLRIKPSSCLARWGQNGTAGFALPSTIDDCASHGFYGVYMVHKCIA